MLSRRQLLRSAAAGLLVVPARRASAQEGVFMTPREAPRQLFPDATNALERTVPATRTLRERMRALLGRLPTVWEEAYTIFTVLAGEVTLGFVVVVEEIGKHRPITFAVGVTPDGAVKDVAVLAYREAYGGEVRERRFLRQYAGKRLADPLQPYRDVRNISGATLSVEATGRAVRKAIAVLSATGTLR